VAKKNDDKDLVAPDADMDRLGEPHSPPMDEGEMAHDPITEPAEAQEQGYYGTVSKRSEEEAEVADLRNDKTYSDLEKNDQGR
jgi:hypothetical protein